MKIKHQINANYVITIETISLVRDNHLSNNTSTQEQLLEHTRSRHQTQRPEQHRFILCLVRIFILHIKLYNAKVALNILVKMYGLFYNVSNYSM